MNTPEKQAKEQKSIDAFLKTFEGVQKGKTEDLLAALYERHRLYKK